MPVNSLRPLLVSVRPRQWLKNLVVFAPLVFSGTFLDLSAVIASQLAFVVLCLLASGLYLINDVLDIDEDRRHPTKRDRPIASGKLAPRSVLLLAPCFILAALALAAYIGPLTLTAAAGFILMNAIYVWGGKRIPILDVMLIGASFVTRVFVGAAAIMVPASAWLLLTLFFLASYLGFTKRVSELKLGSAASRHALQGYTSTFLDHARTATLAVTLSLYTLYTFASPVGSAMALTIPFVFFGLLRYQAIVDRDDGGNDGPSDHIYLDRQLQLAVLFWGVAVLTIILLVP